MAPARDDRQQRLRTIPPPPSVLPEHTLIDDADEPVSIVLWRAVREVSDWARALPTERSTLFGAMSEVTRERLVYASAREPGLADAFGVFGTLRSSPELLSADEIAAACDVVVAWADQRSLVQTAFLFAEAAARVTPDDPARNSHAGRWARHAGQRHRAEIWYDRARGLAARYKIRRELIRALLGAGSLYRETGRYAHARALIDRAARLASSTRRHRQAAEAEHDLMAIAAEAGTYHEAELHVRAALLHYPLRHPGVPRMVHDWGFLLVRYKLYPQALEVLLNLPAHASRPELESLYSGTLARAAAGAGRRDVYEKARARVVTLTGLHPEFAAAALANTAEGARHFGRWDEGERLAGRAVELARERGEADVQRGALEILDAILTRQPPEPPAAPPQPNRLDTISRRMLHLLEQRRKGSGGR